MADVQTNGFGAEVRPRPRCAGPAPSLTPPSARPQAGLDAKVAEVTNRMASLASDMNGHSGTVSPPVDMLKADKALEAGLADGAKGGEGGEGAVDGMPADSFAFFAGGGPPSAAGPAGLASSGGSFCYHGSLAVAGLSPRRSA